MQLNSLVRTVLSTLTAVVLLLAVCLTTAGLATPSWQTVELFQPHQQHQRGLWEDCVAGQRNVQNSGWICIYKHYGHTDSRNWMPNGQLKDAFEYNMADHEDWKLTVLILITLAAIVGLFAMFCSCCATLNRCFSVTTTVLSAVAALSSIVGVVYFVRQANDPSVKFVLAATETSEQKLGSSFFLAVAGSVLFILGFLLSGFCTTMAFLTSSSMSSMRRHSEDVSVSENNARRRPRLSLDFSQISSSAISKPPYSNGGTRFEKNTVI